MRTIHDDKHITGRLYPQCIDPTGYGLSKLHQMMKGLLNTRTFIVILGHWDNTQGHMTIDGAVKHFNISRSTIIKWRKREDLNDKSHRPDTLKTALLPTQEVIVVELRCTLLLALNDPLVVSREFIDKTLSRHHYFVYHGVNRLSQLYAEQSENMKKLKRSRTINLATFMLILNILPTCLMTHKNVIY